MIDEIETGIVSYLQQQWPENGGDTALTEFDINLDFEDIVKYPSVSVATERMQVRESTPGTFKMRPTISLYSVYKDVGRANIRRLAIYPMVVASMRMLAGQTLGLDIDELIPTSIDEVHHEKLKDMGAICFQTQFITGFTTESIDPQDAVTLLCENLKYFLGDDNTPGTENATDIITY